MRTRYRQVQKEDGSYELVQIDGDAVARANAVVGSARFEPYRSPIDGSVITSARQHEEHKRRHGVVELREFGDEHWKRAEKEREKVYRPGKRTARENWHRRAVIHEAINKLERGG